MNSKTDYLDKLKNINVSEYTSVFPTTITPETSFNNVYEQMYANNIRHLPVVENDKVIGIISQRDLLSSINLSEREVLSARCIMNEEPYTVYETAPLDEVCFAMSSEKIGSAIVLDKDDKLVGLFTTTDALNALVETLRGEVEV